MELDFDKTYSNVRFQKWEKFFSFESWIDEFIADIKNENPEMIIVSDERKRCGDGYYATIIGMSTESKTLKDYSFIEDFTVHTKINLDSYLGNNHTLLFWSNFHRDVNTPLIEKIRNCFCLLRDTTIEEYKRIVFDYLRKNIYELKPLLWSEEDAEMLSQGGIDHLNEYNRTIKIFQDKFRSVEKDLAKALGISFNFDKDEYEYEEE